MDDEASTIVQILILALGVYMLLSFLRTTRGSGMVRGVGVAILLAVLLLYGVSLRFELEELNVLLKGIAGFLVVILAIIFQPELRRGMVSLGENQLIGRFMKAQRDEVLAEVSNACISMAKKKQGALIAFERQTPLDAYIESGVHVDSEVTRLILDSIFHHGAALHDGAVVIRDNRIEAAACLFPLTENIELSKSTGTRHRAALGLTEETDAVTVMVSEETGFISVCKGGKLERRVARGELEHILSDRIGVDDGSAPEESISRLARVAKWVRGAFTDHIAQKAASVLIAVGVFVLAYKQVYTEETYVLTLEHALVTDSAPLSPGKLLVLRPSQSFEVLDPAEGSKFSIIIEGTRDDHAALRTGLAAAFTVTEETMGLALDANLVSWSPVAGTLSKHWEDKPPILRMQSFATTEVDLDPAQVEVNWDDLDSYYEVDEEQLTFPTTTKVEITGPQNAIADIETRVEFKPIVLTSETREDINWQLELTEALRDENLEIKTPVFLHIPVVPAQLRLSSIDIEPTLQCFDPTRPDLVDKWKKPAEKVQLNIYVKGILPRNLDADEGQNEKLKLSDYATTHVRCFIDVAKLEGQDSKVALIETGGLKRWRDDLKDRFPVADLDPDADLWVEIVGEKTIRLEEVEPTEPTNGNGEREDKE
ncbi:MAG: TIGR00159 family protein [bacterium]|nr:TIGR00159 family protein [bacterium]